MSGPELTYLEHRAEGFGGTLSTLVLPTESLLCSYDVGLTIAAARAVLAMYEAAR